MDPAVVATLGKTTQKVLDGFFAYPLVVALGAVVMRVGVKREKSIAEGNPPRTLSLRGFRPARTHRWWVVTHVIKTPAGWERFDRMLFGVSVVGVAIAVLTLVIGGILALTS
ncbi:MAG TPA: hypothetical protein VK428_01625 [Acidimicrobiales bacterium]|nr:hypothetical protein [Acidimicrobiales bacterium]